MPKASRELRNLRYERDLSAADAGKAVYIAEGTVRNIENGTTTASWRLLHRFARLYGVKVDALLSDEVKADAA